MNRELIEKTEVFLKETFGDSEHADYRIRHSYRVAHIAEEIAEKEGFDVTNAVIAALLHDIGYSQGFESVEDWKEHGRKGAKIVRPFLESLGLPEKDVNDICFAIAVHVDDQSDFEGEFTPFTRTLSDADNIDHMGPLRIFENLVFTGYTDGDHEAQKAHILGVLSKLKGYYEEPLATVAATKLWRERIAFYMDYYERLLRQILHEEEI